MNLLMYFCIPLVVTGQMVRDRSHSTGRDSDKEDTEDVERQEVSETGLYSQHEYGSHVGYKNALDEFAVGQHGEYYRRPSSEDSGEVGKPSIYNTDNGGNNDHPSFIASNIYNSIKEKKNGHNGGSNSSQLPSPLAYGVPLAQDQHSAHNAALIASHHQSHHDHHLQNLYAEAGPVHETVSPIAQKVPIAQQQVLFQDPHTGQLLQSPAYPNGLVPLYHQSLVAPQVAYASDAHLIDQQVHVSQKVVPSLKTVNHYQEQLVGKTYAPHHQQVLLKAPTAPATPVYQGHHPHLLKTGIAQSYLQLVKANGEPVHATHTPENALYYHPQLLKNEPVYQTPLVAGPTVQEHVLKTHVPPAHLLKGPDAPLYYYPPLLKSEHHQHLKTTVPVHSPLLKDGGAPLYYYPNPSLLRYPVGTPYHGAVVKTEQAPLLLKSPDHPVYHQVQYLKSPNGEIYQAPVVVPVANHHPHTPVILKEAVSPLYQQQVLNDATPHTLLKTSGIPTYHQQVIKTAGPVYQQHLLKTAAGPVYQQHLLKTAAGPVYQQHLLKTAHTPLLKTPQVEATIVPAVEEHVHGIHQPAYVPLIANNVLAHHAHPQYLALGPQVLVAPKHQKVIVQKAVVHKSPVLTEKAVLKATLSPVYSNPAVDTQNAIFKAPLYTHFVQNGHLEPNLPQRILSSQKALVNSLISSDKVRGGKATGLFAEATNIELVPSLSYGYSFSLYPRANGEYGPPQHSQRHIK